MYEMNKEDRNDVNSENNGGNKSDSQKQTDLQDLQENVAFEQALKLTGIGYYNYTLMAITIYSLLASSGEMFSVGFLVPLSQCDLQLDVQKKGLIGAVPMLGVIAGAHFWGYLADTRGRRFALLLSMSGSFVMATIASFSHNWIFMVISKFISSVFTSGTNAVIYTLLGESTPETHRAKYLMYGSTGIMLNQATMALLSFPILRLDFEYELTMFNVTYRPWRLLAQVIGIASAINLLLVYFFTYESAKFYFAKGDQDAGLEILKKIYRDNSKDKEATYSVKHVILDEDINKSKNQNIFLSIWYQTVPLFYKVHLKNTLLACYLCIVTYCVSPAFTVWLPQIFNSFTHITDPDTKFCGMLQKPANGQNVTTNASMIIECNDRIEDFSVLALAVFSCYLTLSSTMALIMIKVIGKKKVFIGVHLVSTIMALMIDRFGATYGMVALVAMLTNVVCMGISTIYTVEMFPTYMRAMVVCLTMMVGRAFSFIFINVLGTQMQNNCSNLLYFLAAFLFSGALVGTFLPPDNKQKSVDDIAINERYTPKTIDA